MVMECTIIIIILMSTNNQAVQNKRSLSWLHSSGELSLGTEIYGHLPTWQITCTGPLLHTVKKKKRKKDQHITRTGG